VWASGADYEKEWAAGGIVYAIQDTPDDRPPGPKRFEKIVGCEVADAGVSHQLAILPLGSQEFHGPHNRPESIPSSSAGNLFFCKSPRRLTGPAIPVT
jgi:hypothetical protein